MEKIMLFRKSDGSIWYRYRGIEAPVSEFNVPMFAQLYKQLGQVPKIGFPIGDNELSFMAKKLTDNIIQTASQLMF